MGNSVNMPSLTYSSKFKTFRNVKALMFVTGFSNSNITSSIKLVKTERAGSYRLSI